MQDYTIPEVPVQEVPPTKPPKKNNTTLIIILVVVGVLLLCCCVLGIGGFIAFQNGVFN
jgi:flagellar basal body-associated protein FliL